MKKEKKADIEQIVEEYTDLLHEGKAPPIEKFLKKYPGLESKLKSELETVRLLVEQGKSLRPMPEALEKKLDNMFWSIIMSKEKQRLLKVKKELKKRRFLPVKKGIEILLLLLRKELPIRGITRIMKLLFLLEKEVEIDKFCPLYYQFIPYKLGPFSLQVYEDLKLLMELGFVKRREIDIIGEVPIHPDDSKIDEGFRFNEITTTYSLTDLGEEYAEKLAIGLKPGIVDKINFIKNRFGQLSLKRLLGYVYQNYPEYTTQSELLKRIIK